MSKKRVTVKRGKPDVDSLACVHPHAAGLDIGAHEVWACVPPEVEGETVRVFGAFTPDLQAPADWLVQCGTDTVAMESTGVYWIPVFDPNEATAFGSGTIKRFYQ